MKLNINAKELLALHNMLYERFEGAQGRDLDEYKDDDPRASDAVQLRQVYNRLRACIVGALTGKAIDPFDAWQSKEQAKIDKLNDELDSVKREQADLPRVTSPEDFGVTTDEDFSMPDYPRRGPRGSGPGKHRGRK
jgi:hypothetical protein